MSKEFICKGCGEKFNKDMQSNNVGYCYICNEFYMQKQVADLEAKLAESEEAIKYLKGIKRYDIGEMLTEIAQLKQQLAEKQKGKIEYTDTINFVETSEPDIVAKELDRLNQQLAEHNEYFRSFSCENFNEFQDFISTFMLTPHEEQTLIRELKQQLAEKEKKNTQLKTTNNRLYKKNKKLENQIVESNIRFYKKGGIEQLEKVKKFFLEEHRDEEMDTDYIITKDAGEIADYLLDQIEQLKKEMK